MIKCRTKNGNTKVKVKGSLGNIAADACLILDTIKTALNKDGSGAGDEVMGAINAAMNDPDSPLKTGNNYIPMSDQLKRLKKQNAAMTAALREHVDNDHLCLMCRYYDQCQAEGENEDDKTTRFWRCKTGEEFEYKEVE